MTVVDLGLDRFRGQETKTELLRLNLALAVPMRIAEYQRDERDADWLIAHAHETWNEKAGAQHEALLYHCKPKTKNGLYLPGTAKVFNWFAEAIACCALVADGGITVFGLHFCGGGCARCRMEAS